MINGPQKIGKRNRNGLPVYIQNKVPKNIKVGYKFTLQKEMKFYIETFPAGTVVEYVGRDTIENAKLNIDHYIVFNRFVFNNDGKKRILDWEEVEEHISEKLTKEIKNEQPR